MAFIAFEGLDGSGKSTLLKGLQNFLQDRKVDVVSTREPGGTQVAEDIREILLRLADDVPSARCEVLLYAASRAQHVDRLIAPSLEARKWVLCDRFVASSIAFQSAGRSLELSDIAWINDFATARLHPDLYVLLDISVEECFERQARRGEAADRLESEGRDFHQSVRDSYLRQAEERPEGWLVLDARLSPEDLLNQLINEIEERKWLA